MNEFRECSTVRSDTLFRIQYFFFLDPLDEFKFLVLWMCFLLEHICCTIWRFLRLAHLGPYRSCISLLYAHVRTYHTEIRMKSRTCRHTKGCWYDNKAIIFSCHIHLVKKYFKTSDSRDSTFRVYAVRPFIRWPNWSTTLLLVLLL